MQLAVAPAARLTPEQEVYWLALITVTGLGPKLAGRLLEMYRAPEHLFRASRSELEARGVPSPIAQTIASGLTFETAAVQQERARAAGVRLVTRHCLDYPAILKSIDDPPTVLFCRGRVELLSTLCVAVVGTRSPTRYGEICADRIAREVAAAGVTVVSGMARGIDTHAHKAALTASGATIAVFGCGVDRVYPVENAALAQQIAERGLVVSEYPMGTPGFPQNYPVRNRIVSGLSQAVVIVEGAQYSGSSITAKLAIEQGRELYAVPGNITSKLSWGPNLMIRQGARLLQDPRDLLEDLGAAAIRTPAPEPEPQQQALFEGPMGGVADSVLRLLSVDAPMHIDAIQEAISTWSRSEITSILLELELTGLVKQLPGRNFVKVWAAPIR